MNREHIDILEQIHAAYYQLTAAERKVADFVLAEYQQVQHMSITQLADECGTAEATISRFCRNLELKGFNAFKLALARHSADVPAKPPVESEDTFSGRVQKSAQLAIDAVNQTAALVRPERVTAAVDIIEKAARVGCMGSGGSMLMASECAHLFCTTTSKFYAVSDSHIQMSSAAIMTEEDAVILFSYSGATTNSLQIMETARARGAKTILVTRFEKSPAAKLADVVLCCGSREEPFQLGTVPARIAQLTVIDILFQEYYHRNFEQCEESVQSIAAALSGMHI